MFNCEEDPFITCQPDSYNDFKRYEDLELFCPELLTTLECIENHLTNCTVREEFFKEISPDRFHSIHRNARELCQKGSPANEAVGKNIECYLKVLYGEEPKCSSNSNEAVDEYFSKISEESDLRIKERVLKGCLNFAFDVICFCENSIKLCGNAATDAAIELAIKSRFTEPCVIEDMKSLSKIVKDLNMEETIATVLTHFLSLYDE